MTMDNLPLTQEQARKILANEQTTAGAPGKPDWNALPVQYADYALWQRQGLGEDDDPASLAARQLSYWRSALADLPAQIALPTDYPRPAVIREEGGHTAIRLDPAVQQVPPDRLNLPLTHSWNRA